MQDGGGRHFKKSPNSHILAPFRPVATKFGIVTHVDPLDRPDR